MHTLKSTLVLFLALLSSASAIDIRLATGQLYRNAVVEKVDRDSVTVRYGAVEGRQYTPGTSSVKIPIRLLNAEQISALSVQWDATQKALQEQEILNKSRMRIWISVSFFRPQRYFVDFRLTNGRNDEFEEAIGEEKQAWMLGKASDDMDQGSRWFLWAYLLGRRDDDSRDYVFTQDLKTAKRILLQKEGLEQVIKDFSKDE